MGNEDLMLAVLQRLHANQLAIGAAVEELGIWVGQRGSLATSEAVQSHLAALTANADFISDTIVALLEAGS